MQGIWKFFVLPLQLFCKSNSILKLKVRTIVTTLPELRENSICIGYYYYIFIRTVLM